MSSEAEIISTRYTKSVIKSVAAMSYIEAQARMDDRHLLLEFNYLLDQALIIVYNLFTFLFVAVG